MKWKLSRFLRILTFSASVAFGLLASSPAAAAPHVLIDVDDLAWMGEAEIGPAIDAADAFADSEPNGVRDFAKTGQDEFSVTQPAPRTSIDSSVQNGETDEAGRTSDAAIRLRTNRPASTLVLSSGWSVSSWTHHEDDDVAEAMPATLEGPDAFGFVESARRSLEGQSIKQLYRREISQLTRLPAPGLAGLMLITCCFCVGRLVLDRMFPQ